MFFKIFTFFLSLFLRTSQLILNGLMFVLSSFVATRNTINFLARFRLMHFIIPFFRTIEQNKHVLTLPEKTSFKSFQDYEIEKMILNDYYEYFCIIEHNFLTTQCFDKSTKTYQLNSLWLDETQINTLEIDYHLFHPENIIFLGDDLFASQIKASLLQYSTHKPFYFQTLNNTTQTSFQQFIAINLGVSDGSVFSNKSFALNIKNHPVNLTDCNFIPNKVVLNSASQIKQNDQKLKLLTICLFYTGMVIYLNDKKLMIDHYKLIETMKILWKMLRTKTFDVKKLNVCSYFIGTSGANSSGVVFDQLAYAISTKYNLSWQNVKIALFDSFFQYICRNQKHQKIKKQLQAFVVELLGNNSKLTFEQFILEFSKYIPKNKSLANNETSYHFNLKEVNSFRKHYCNNYGMIFDKYFVSFSPKTMNLVIADTLRSLPKYC